MREIRDCVRGAGASRRNVLIVCVNGRVRSQDYSLQNEV